MRDPDVAMSVAMKSRSFSIRGPGHARPLLKAHGHHITTCSAGPVRPDPAFARAEDQLSVRCSLRMRPVMGFEMARR